MENLTSATGGAGVRRESPGPGVRLLVMLAAAVLAAGLCDSVLRVVGTVYPTPEEVLSLPAVPTDEERASARAAQFGVDRGNAVVWMSITGAVLGSALAVAVGCLYGSGYRIAVGGVAGIVFGGALGCAAGTTAITISSSLTATLLGSASAVEHKFMMLHGSTWGLVGLGVGLACGLSRPQWQWKPVMTSTLVGGAAGGVAGVVFPVVAAIALPLVDSAQPIPPVGYARLVWIALASTFMGAGISRIG